MRIVTLKLQNLNLSEACSWFHLKDGCNKNLESDARSIVCLPDTIKAMLSLPRANMMPATTNLKSP